MLLLLGYSSCWTTTEARPLSHIASVKNLPFSSRRVMTPSARSLVNATATYPNNV